MEKNGLTEHDEGLWRTIVLMLVFLAILLCADLGYLVYRVGAETWLAVCSGV